jgi:hypothetical protein
MNNELGTLHNHGSSRTLTNMCGTVVVVASGFQNSVLRVFRSTTHNFCAFCSLHTSVRRVYKRSSLRQQVIFFKKVVARLIQLVTDYEQRLRRIQHVPDLSYRRRIVRDDGDPNRFFLTYLFTDQAVAIEFLQDVGPLRSQMPCDTCGRDMTWASDSSVREGFRWRCQKRVSSTYNTGFG